VNKLLETPIEFLDGVGVQRAKLLKTELGLVVFEDLLWHFPFRYVDRSVYHTVSDLPYIDMAVQLRGVISQIKDSKMGTKRRLSAIFSDSTGSVELIWFQGIDWISSSIKTNIEVQIYGKAKKFNNKWQISHPEVVEYSKVKNEKGWQPVYSTTEKLSSKKMHSKWFERIIKNLLNKIELIPETLPQTILQRNKLMNLRTAFTYIHQPKSNEHALHARMRFKFEELFYLQLELLIRKQLNLKKTKSYIFERIGSLFTDFYHNKLNFELTTAQKRVVKEIRQDFLTGNHVSRLLQGDVGSGKTLVALLTALIAIDNGYQVAIVAPTELLSQQHKETICTFLNNIPIKVELLTGSTKAKDRRVILENLLLGDIHILVGTHALLEDTVRFKNLGLVIIDEQHRFGVAQRYKMLVKNDPPPHIIVMTATPIPRTLAMTFYGDLDVSIIDELPPGRQPVKTVHLTEKDRLQVFGFIRKEIKKGRQVYVVYPLIKESQKLDFNNLMDGFEAISRSFPLPKYQISIVHGQMKPEDKEFEMQRFVKGQTHIMVATTVIEVGVNVPNASVMIIESAERFGLSQLHQLRGRVGRGNEQSYCILMTSDLLSKDTKKRIETMVRTNDGFEIAEVDLTLRGPGDILGTQQSGLINLKIADLTTDAHLVSLAREEARKLLNQDPNIEKTEHVMIRETITNILSRKTNWSEIA